jgi:hypothetical protein
MANDLSTQENCNWLVQVGKKELTLNQEQYNLLVKADQEGNIKMVHYKDFSINLGYVSYMEKIKRAETYSSADDPFVNGELDKEIANMEKLGEMREKLLNKGE